MDINQNKIIMMEGIKDKYFSDNIDSQYEEFKALSDREEYSKGNSFSFYGYYSPMDLYEWLNVNNYVRGKLYLKKPKKYDFIYYFSGDKLIMVEKYLDSELSYICFYYHQEKSTFILGYEVINKKRLYSVAKCEYDDKGRQISFIFEQSPFLEKEKIDHFTEYLYKYTTTELIITHGDYCAIEPLPIYREKAYLFREFRFPISILEKRNKYKELIKVENETVYNFLYKKITNIISNWQIKNGYAVSVLLKGVNNIELSYNEETDKNQDLASEERWNIAFWQQDVIGFVLDTAEEKDFFLNWMEYVDYKKDKIYSITDLIENRLFHKVLFKVLDQIHEDDLIKKVFGKEVPIIIHNLDYCDYSIQLTRKANKNKELIKDFEDWIEADF
ncbi:MAG: hypothetical protein FWE36_00420 [Erysipelotrichales bacterium]|nr:hypothetical protein [Erysipelotrichales bacterium]